MVTRPMVSDQFRLYGSGRDMYETNALNMPGGNNSTGRNFPSSLIDEDPNLGYLTFLRSLGLSPGRERFLTSQFPRIQNMFNANLGQQLTQGQIPTTSFFHDFLPNFNLRQFESGFSPSSRGLGTANFLGRGTRFLF